MTSTYIINDENIHILDIIRRNYPCHIRFLCDNIVEISADEITIQSIDDIFIYFYKD